VYNFWSSSRAGLFPARDNLYMAYAALMQTTFAFPFKVKSVHLLEANSSPALPKGGALIKIYGLYNFE